MTDQATCPHTNTMRSRNIFQTLICLDCGKRDPFANLDDGSAVYEAQRAKFHATGEP